MGGSSVPSSTTQTTMLDPTRQAALKQAMGYFNKWAQNYNGPAYKGPLVAGRTQDWYEAQRMAHNMANRFASGGVTSLRRFDDGGGVSLSVSPEQQTSYNQYIAAQQPTTSSVSGYDPNAGSTFTLPNIDNSVPVNNAPNYASITPNYDPNQVTLTSAPYTAPAVTTSNISGYDPNQVTLTSAPYTAPAVTTSNISGGTNAPANNITYSSPFSSNAGISSILKDLNNPNVSEADKGILLSLLNTESQKLAAAGTSGGAGNVDTLGGAGTSGGAGNVVVPPPTLTGTTGANYTPAATTSNQGSPFNVANMASTYALGALAGLNQQGLQSRNDVTNAYANPDQLTPGTISSGYVNPEGYSSKDISVDAWNKAMMDNYMSPYTQGVVDIALREAARNRAIERLRENTAATQAGAFGGYRQGVVEAEGERNYNQSLNDITTKGYQAAYNDAVAQFQADREAKLRAAQANQANALSAYQATQAAKQAAGQMDLTAQQNNQANALAAYQANEAAKQQAAQLGMSADQYNFGNALNYYNANAGLLNNIISGSQGLGSLATAQQAADINTQNALKGYSADTQAQNQSVIDALSKYIDALTNTDLAKANNSTAIAGTGNNQSNVQISSK